jgi:tetratricopeptide (TPR) repeat protein
VERAPKPEDLPTDRKPELPGAVLREIRKAVQNDHLLAEQIGHALAFGAAAIDEDDPETALRYLTWAKETVPRSPALREALGIARYLHGDYASALTELQAYRRLSGRPDQNHIVADCLRALDRETDRIADLAEEMQDHPDVPLERAVEGTIVWASAVADTGDVGAARAIIRRGLERLPAGEPEDAHLRLWFVAGDLADRAGDLDDARRWFSRVAEEAPDAFDVEARLAELADREP